VTRGRVDAGARTRAPAFDLPGTDGENNALGDFESEALLLVSTCDHCPYAQAKFDALNPDDEPTQRECARLSMRCWPMRP
jgi:peroxiredoxin